MATTIADIVYPTTTLFEFQPNVRSIDLRKATNNLVNTSNCSAIFKKIEDGIIATHRTKLFSDLKLPIAKRQLFDQLDDCTLMMLYPTFYQAVVADVMHVYANYIMKRMSEEDARIEEYMKLIETIVERATTVEKIALDKISGEDLELSTQGIFDTYFQKATDPRPTDPLPKPETPASANTQFRKPGLFGIDVNIPDEITEAARNFNSGVKGTKNGISKIKEIIEGILPQSAQSSGSTYGKITDKIMHFIVSIINIVRASSVKDKLSILLQTLLGFGISITDRLIKSATVLVNIIAECLTLPKIPTGSIEIVDFDESDPLLSQGKEPLQFSEIVEDLSELEDAVFDIATTMITQGMEKEHYARPSYFNIGKTLVDCRNFIQLAEILVAYGKRVFLYLHMKILGYPYITDSTKDLVDKAVSWMDYANKCVNETEPGDLVSNVLYCQQIVNHHNKADIIAKELILLGFNQHNFTPFFRAVAAFQTIYDQAHNVLHSAQPRLEPLFLELTGMPGVGKSSLLTKLCRSLLAFYNHHMGVENDLNNISANIFERKPKNIYWDGFMNQFMTTSDDCFAFDDQDRQTEIAEEIINMLNTAPYPLHMAELSQKANTFFNSKVVVITNNSMQNGYYNEPQLKLTEPLAFARRKHFLIEVQVQPRFCRIEKDRNGRECTRVTCTEILDDIWQFRKIDPVSLNYLTPWISYDELISDICYKFESILKKTASFQNSLTKDISVPKAEKPKDYSTVVGNCRPIPKNGSGDKIIRRDHRQTRQLKKETQTFNNNAELLIAQGFHTKSKAVKHAEDYQDLKRNPTDKRDPIEITYDGKKIRVEPYTVLANQQLWFVGCPTTEDKNAEKEYYLFDDCEVPMSRVSILEKTKAIFAQAKSEISKFTSAHPWAYATFSAITLALSVIGLLGLAWYALKPEEEAEAQSLNPSAPNRNTNTDQRKAKVDQVVTRTIRLKPLHTQMDINAQEVGRKCTKNYVNIHFSQDVNILGPYCTAVFLKDTIAITAAHMLSNLIDANNKMTGYITLIGAHPDNAEFKAQFRFEDCSLVVAEDADLAAFNFPLKTRRFSNICSQFVTDKELNGNISRSFLQVCQAKTEKNAARNYQTLSGNTCLANKVTYKDTYTGETRVNPSSIKYIAPHYPGECGSLCLINNSNFVGKIAGMHIAGNTTTGISTVLTQDAVNLICESFGNPNEIFTSEAELVQHGLEDEYQPDWLDHAKTMLDSKQANVNSELKLDPAHAEYLGKVKPEFYHRMNLKDSYKPSKLQDVITPHVTNNSRLKKFTDENGKTVSPLENALKYFCKEQPKMTFTEQQNYLCRSIVRQVLASINVTSTMRIVDVQEAIDGLPEYTFFGSLHMKTAPGFGCKGMKWTPDQIKANPELTNKGKWFCFYEENIYFMDGTTLTHNVPKLELLQEITRMEEAYKNGMRYQNIAEMNLKSERLNFEKVATGATRAFYISQLAHTILGRMYFGTALDNIMTSMKSTGITLGINPDSIDWEWVVKGPNWTHIEYVDGDFSKADFRRDANIESILHEELIEWNLDQIFEQDVKFEKHFPREVMKGLLSDISFTIILLVVDELWKLNGNYFLSGAFCTAVLNSLYYKVALLYSYQTHLNILHSDLMKIVHEKHMKITDFIAHYQSQTEFQKTHPRPDIWEFCRKLDNHPLLPPQMSTTVERARNFSWLLIDFLEAYRSLPDPGVIQTRTNGDDFILLLNGNCHINRYFTFYDLVPIALLTGHVITPSDKKGKGFTYTPLHELTYLKRRFVPYLQYMLAPLERKVIDEVPQWITISSLDEDQALRDNVQWCLEEFFHYGPKVMIEMTERYNKELIKLNIDPIVVSFHDRLDRFLGVGKYSLDERTIKSISMNGWDCAAEERPDWFRVEDTRKLELACQGHWDLETEIGYASVPMALFRPTVRTIKLNSFANVSTQETSYESEEELFTQGDTDPQGVTPVLDVEQEGLTVTQETVVPADVPSHSNIQKIYLGTNPFPQEDLNAVMTRLMRVANFSWTTAQAADQLLAVLNFPYAMLNINPNLVDKINQWHYLRANVDVEVRLNGTNFHAGKLQISYQSYCSGTSSNWKHMNVFTQSTCKTVHLSAGTNQTVRFTIPYCAPFAFWQHTKDGNEGHIGSVYIKILNPLRVVGGSTTLTLPVSVWARFQPGYELAGPTLHSQGNEKHEQKAKSSQGILSKALEAGSTLASTLAPVPLIGSAAALGANVLGKASSVAKLFGFDKPNSVESFKPVMLSLTNGSTPGDGMNTVQELSMSVENTLSTDTGRYGEQTMHSDIDKLATLPGLFAIGSIATTDTAGKIMMTWHNTPMLAHSVVQPVSGYAKADLIPCSAVGYLFENWRGTMKYCIQFVGSKFHRMRVRISYHPTFDEIPTDFTEGEGDFISKVVDIDGDTTVTFSVPFLKETLYCKVKDTWLSPRPYDSYAGAIAISIVNPLTTMSMTMPPMEFNVWAACHEDMEFNMPINREGYRLLLNSPAALEGTLVAQGDNGDENLSIRDIFLKDFPSLIPGQGLKIEKVCVGEHVQSVYDLLHRFQKLNNGTLTSGALYEVKDVPNDVDTGYPIDKTIPFLENWFLFHAGGYQFKFMPTSQTAMPDGTLYVFGSNGAPVSDSKSNYWDRNGFFCENFHYKPCLEVSLPYYSLYPYQTPTGWHIYPQEWDEGDLLNQDTNKLVLNYHGINSVNLAYVASVATKDDYTLGLPEGCPRIWHTNFSDPEEEGIVSGPTADGPVARSEPVVVPSDGKTEL